MKKIIFSIVGSMLSLCVVQAQQQSDTTGTASQRQQQNSQYDQSRQQTDRTRQQSDRTRHQGDNQAWQQQGDRNQYANEGMVEIDKNELPATLKQTLKQKKYAGWENGTIYHNTNTGEYVIAPRAYRFDDKGKEMEMGSYSQDYGNRQGAQGQGTQGRYSSGDLNSQNPSRTRESETTQSPSQQNQSSQGEDQSTQSSQNQKAQGQSQYPSQSSSQDQADNSQSSQTQRSGSTDQTQKPSSSYRTDQSSQSGTRTQSDTDTQSQSGQSSQNQYRTEDMVEIQAEQVPAALRKTLKGSQYKGWEENGTLYQDPSSSEYVLEMQSANDASQPRIYRFDKSGQLKPGQNGTGNSDQ